MNEALLLLLVLAAVLTARLWPSWRHPQIGSDAGFHLLLRREIRRGGFRPPARLEACLFDRTVGYPWLYHQFIALFPESWLRRLPALPSALADAAQTGLVFLAGRALAGRFAPGADPAWTGFVCAALYGLNPAMLAHGVGPRAFEITPRPFGELLFTISLGSALLAAYLSSWAWAAVSVLAGAGVLLSSKFAVQVMLFFMPLLSFLPGLHRLWLVPLASLPVALALSAGRYRHVLRGQVRHLDYFRRKLQYTFGTVANRNRWQDVRLLAATVRGHGLFSRAAASAASDFYFHNTYLQMATRGVLFLLLAVLCAGGSFRGILLYRWLLGWAWVWVLPFLLTSWRHARFLGEAERYAGYSIAPAALLVGLGLVSRPVSGLLAAGLVLYALVTIVIFAHALRSHARSAGLVRDARRELAGFLGGLPAGAVLLGAPEELVLGPVASLLPHRFADIMADMDLFVEKLEHHCDGYPWPRADWAFWRAAGVQYVVARHPDEIRAVRPDLKYDFASLERLFSNDAYDVYRL
ncbi:MAG TPA: hypothetical protein P5567_03570 [Kiritimatiellia bacterium]|nr:hypothetical protein [Kiritimatiellia bacterium]HRZ11515.1 hypothetical protein [Kiritimatiellia bacterium]HSA16934.1 hypothetical protein [Kiritimatiellia bacterium]